jgi:hypothetical protein
VPHQSIKSILGEKAEHIRSRTDRHRFQKKGISRASSGDLDVDHPLTLAGKVQHADCLPQMPLNENLGNSSGFLKTGKRYLGFLGTSLMGVKAVEAHAVVASRFALQRYAGSETEPSTDLRPTIRCRAST